MQGLSRHNICDSGLAIKNINNDKTLWVRSVIEPCTKLYSKKTYLPCLLKWTWRAIRAAGVTPDMRDAWPRDKGFTFESFSRTSLVSP